MNIVRIIYDWPPPWSGLVPAPYELTVSQTKLGHTVDVFCGRWPRAGTIEEPKGAKVHAFWREPIFGMMTVTTSVLMFFHYLNWRRNHKPDVIHAHGHFAIWIFFYRYILKKFFKRWSKELKVPLVVHFHNTAQGRWESLNKQGTQLKTTTKYFVYPMEVWANKLAVDVADALIFVSDKLKTEAISFYKTDPAKCFVIESGVNPNLFKTISREERDKSRRDLSLDLYDKVILNYGVMTERKNIHLLVEALEHLPINYKLLLVGPGDPEYMYKVDESIQLKKLDGRVIKAGYTPYPQIPIAIQVSDLFVLPSAFEGQPKVVIESLCCGVPVLGSGFKLSTDVEGLYYLNNISPENIAAEIRRVLENPHPVNVAKILHGFTWDYKAQQVDKVYEFVKNIPNTK